MTKQPSTNLSNIASTSWIRTASLVHIFWIWACNTAAAPSTPSSDSVAADDAQLVATGPQPRVPNDKDCSRTRSGAQPTGCVPEFDYDQHQAILTVWLKVLAEAPKTCLQGEETGSAGWLPPIESRCSWAPDRKCHAVSPKSTQLLPWEFIPSSLEGIGHWRKVLGDTFSSDLDAASNFHMRFSWKRGNGLCLVVFESWGDTDNDGRYYAEVAGALFDEKGELFKSRKALVAQRDSREKTRSPGAPVPLTLDIFANDNGEGTLLENYILGRTDGASYPEPLENYADWAKRHAPI